MSAGASDAKKRNKKRYGAGPQSKRWKGPRELEVGMQGILITCNMNERKCTAEAFNLLNEYAEELYGPEKVGARGGWPYRGPWVGPSAGEPPASKGLLGGDVLLCSKLEDNDGASSEEEEADEDDVAAALKKEVAQLQAGGARQERRFQALQSGANNVIFIKTHNLGTCFHALAVYSGPPASTSLLLFGS